MKFSVSLRHNLNSSFCCDVCSRFEIMNCLKKKKTVEKVLILDLLSPAETEKSVAVLEHFFGLKQTVVFNRRVRALNGTQNIHMNHSFSDKSQKTHSIKKYLNLLEILLFLMFSFFFKKIMIII